MFIRSIIGLFVLAVGHAVGIAGAYWIYPWFDTPMHFLGGFVAGIIALDIWRFAVADLKMRINWIKKEYILFIFVLGVVSFIGIVWELHEFILDDLARNAGIVRQPSIADTMKDFVMDLIGGFFAYVIFRKSIK